MSFESCYGREFDKDDTNCKACCVAKECDRLKSLPDAKIQQAPLEVFFKTIENKLKIRYTPRNDGFIAVSENGLEVEVKAGLVTVKNGEDIVMEPAYLLSNEDAKQKAESIL